jgi:uncharacterized protein (TIGR03382 family)
MRLVLGITLISAVSALPAWSQECDGASTSEACGAPNQSGGGGGGGGGSILINFTDQGDSYQYADDYDNDGIEDNVDNCPFAFDAQMADGDADGFGDACDLCPQTSAPFVGGVFVMRDTDSDGAGDECDSDDDNDGILNDLDNCLGVMNPFTGIDGLQVDTDRDGRGDACDDDDDNDGCTDATDNCPALSAANCQDSNAVVADECFPDADADGIEDNRDNCFGQPNQAQADADSDGVGDDCDGDLDNDGLSNTQDNCVQVPNGDRTDADHDGLGDACDARLCYVIGNDQANCLDPVAPFAVRSNLNLAVDPATFQLETVLTGQPYVLELYANREQTDMRYTWVVVEQPADGDADIAFPKGAVSVSNGIEYVYTPGEEPTFTAFVPGTYVVELSAELAFPSRDAYGTARSTSRTTINVGGSSQSRGCAAAPPALPVGIALLGLILRRRKRA